MRTLVFTAVTVLALAVAGASRPAATVTKTVTRKYLLLLADPLRRHSYRPKRIV